MAYFEEPPPLVHGHKQIRRWLASIGIRVSYRTVGRLCEDLRLFGSSTTVEVDRRHLKHMVSVITETPYEVWIQRWEASPKKEPLFLEQRKDRASMPGRFGGIWSLFVAVEGVEHLVRLESGKVFVAFNKRDFWMWGIEPRQYATTMASFTTSRLALAEDFVARARPQAESVLCARLMRRGVMRSIRVDGSEFGIKGMTPLIAPMGWEGWPYWRVKVQSKFPDAVWTCYSNREDLDRFARTKIPPTVVRPTTMEA